MIIFILFAFDPEYRKSFNLKKLNIVRKDLSKIPMLFNSAYIVQSMSAFENKFRIISNFVGYCIHHLNDIQENNWCHFIAKFDPLYINILL